MKRPQSAKPGYRGYWGQASNDDITQSRGTNRNRKQVHLMKPDLTTHQFSRVLPKKMMHDKERLYSEALQLKQNLNDVMDQNIRLKTKISILQKEKDKINRYIQTAPEGALASKGNSRLNIYGSRATEKENLMVRNLKKMVREAKQENEYLKAQNTKIKKTIKYTRINELQIEKKMVVDQNKRLSTLLEEYGATAADAEGLQSQNYELKKYLQEQIEENKQIDDQKYKYKEIAEDLQDKLKTEIQKNQAKEKKLQRDLALQKRRLNEANKCIEELRKQVRNLQHAQSEAMKKKPVQKPVRPQTSHPGGLKIGTLGKGVTSTQPKEGEDVETIKLKNKQLELELREIKLKLQQSQLQIKKRQNTSPKKAIESEKIEIKQQIIEEKPPTKKEIEIKKEQIKQKTQTKIEQKKNETQNSILVNYFGDPGKSNQQLVPQQLETGEVKQKQKIQVKAKEEETYGDAQFEKEQEENYNDEFEEEKPDAQIQKLKKDFEDNDDEEEIYKKDEKSEKKTKKTKKQGKKGKTKGKDHKQSKVDYKPDKKILTEIRQLLTYRMKAQRYPFSDLQSDIKAAQSQQFTYADLCNMLVNEPFYLTSTYTRIFLSYCYEKQDVESDQLLTASVLIAKLKKVINAFEMVDENQEKEMILRIAEMTSAYPAQLQNAFESIKNGEETVTKQDLINMFQKLQLEDKYIDLIISELSLCSDDLQHLNFHGFFERFYMEDEEGPEVNAIEEQSQESAYNSSRAKKTKTKKHEQEEDVEPSAPFMLAPEQPITNKNYNFDDEDIVSDDGHI